MKTIENRKILGMLTPSSNTVLEPMTHDMLADLDDVSAHFARFRVTEITLSDYGLGQFDKDPFLGAAGLLGDAKCDVIAWNGTSGGWRGFGYDEEICAQITAATGAGATTSILANNDLFRRHGVSRFGLVTPYTDDVQAKILANYAAAGFTCVAESHLGISDNFAFSEIDDDTVMVHGSERGRVKQMLLKIGWPAEDLAGYVDGEAHPINLAQDGWALRDYQEMAAESFWAGGSGVVVLPCG
ncbi:MAG: hypothetical protein ACPGVX_11340, partial [Thalassobaculaceae bacterium]